MSVSCYLVFQPRGVPGNLLRDLCEDLFELSLVEVSADRVILHDDARYAAFESMGAKQKQQFVMECMRGWAREQVADKRGVLVVPEVGQEMGSYQDFINQGGAWVELAN